MSKTLDLKTEWKHSLEPSFELTVFELTIPNL